MPWLNQVSHWFHTTLLSLRGLSIVSIVLIVVCVVVAIRLLSGLLRIIVPVALVVVGGYLLLHVVFHVI